MVRSRKLSKLDDPAALENLRRLVDDFDKQADEIAIVSFLPDGKAELSYGELAQRIRGLAAELQGCGMRKSDRAIIAGANSIEWIIACLAVVYSGGIAVPIDALQGQDELRHIITDSAASWIFADQNALAEIQKNFPSNKFKFFRLEHCGANRCAAENLFEPAEEELGSETAFIFYTSGTSGMPKGVPLSHANVMMQLNSVIRKSDLLIPGDRLLIPLPLYHVYPLNVGLLSPLSMGLPVILPLAATGPEILRALNEAQATVVIAVPRLLRSLYSGIDKRVHTSSVTGKLFDLLMFCCETLDRAQLPNLGRIAFRSIRNKFSPSLRMFACGGALLEPDLAAKIRAIGWELAIGYGLTETAPLLTIRFPEDRNLSSVGKPIPGVSIRIAGETEHSEGEIEARGPNIFHGYLNLPELNKEAFTEDGWFKTGDLGFFKGGFLHISGRVSSTLVLEGGKKIQPEILEKKYSVDESIREIGILQKEHRLVALVLPELSQILSKEELKILDEKSDGDRQKKVNSMIRRKISKLLQVMALDLPGYQRISDFAITRQALPRTNLGKIKRKELGERYEQARKENDYAAHDSSNQENISPEDKALLNNEFAAKTWSLICKRFSGQALNLDMSPQLDLNVDSFEWMNLSLEILEETGIELNEQSIAKIGTLRDLLSEVASMSAKEKGNTQTPVQNPEAFISKEQAKWLQPLNPIQTALSGCLYGLVWFIMRVFFRVSPRREERLPARQTVFIPNHASYLDVFSLISVLPFSRMRNTQIAAWVGIAFANSFFSFLSRLGQTFPVDPKNSLITSIALAAAVLRKGKSLIWFPEGERTLSGELLPFRPGIGILLEDMELPVVPVYLRGTREALPPGAYLPRFFKEVTVVFGASVLPSQLISEGHGKTTAERIANALHDRVESLSRSGSSYSSSKGVRARQSKRNGLGKTTASSK